MPAQAPPAFALSRWRITTEIFGERAWRGPSNFTLELRVEAGLANILRKTEAVFLCGTEVDKRDRRSFCPRRTPAIID